MTAAIRLAGAAKTFRRSGQVTEALTPIEDASVNWPSPYTTVARLSLPRQDTASAKGQELAAEAEAGVSRSALRAWYRAGEIPSRLVDSPHGPQRIVPLDAVLDRAARSPRLRRQAERDQGLAQEVTALRQRLDEVERRLAALEERDGG